MVAGPGETDAAGAIFKPFLRRSDMNVKFISTISMTLLLGASSAMASAIQHEGHTTKKEMSHDHMMMANDTHHILAMAYHQNLATFAKALHEQTASASSVDAEFARAAVTEMRRSFDQMKQHHDEHMKTMSADMHAKMSGMIQKMETHQTEVNTQLSALEKEVQSANPDAKKVSTLAASIHTHCDAMSKMNHGDHEHEMKMKMKMKM